MRMYVFFGVMLFFIVACQPSGSNKQAKDQTTKDISEENANKSNPANQPVALSDALRQAKEKCKYQNATAIDISKVIPCDFKTLKPVTEEEFKKLNLSQYLKKTNPINITFEKNYFYYYAFQTNMNGNVMVALMYCMEGMANELVGIVYNKTGKLLSHTTLAYNSADRDMVWNFGGVFKPKGVYQYEYKQYLVTEDNVCEWYTSDLSFSAGGNIIFGDTTFKVKADPQVPCDRGRHKENKLK